MTYQGWTNRETFTTYLWLGSGEYIYWKAVKFLKNKKDKVKAMKQFILHLHKQRNKNDFLNTAFKDIKNINKINWNELSGAFVDDFYKELNDL